LVKLRDLDVSIFSVPSETTAGDKKTLLIIQDIIRHFQPNYIYLEIGSHLGGTLVPHLVDPLCRHVYSIDKRPPSVPDERGVVFDYPGNSTQRMLDTLKQHVSPSAFVKLQTLDADISDLNKNQIQMEVDFIFIDAEHTNVAVFRDFLSSLQFAKQSFLAAFHDANLLSDGIQNIETFLEYSGIPFKSYFLPDVVYAIAARDMVRLADQALQRLRVDRKKFIEWSRISRWENISNNMAVVKRGEIGHRTSVGSLNFVERESGTRHLEEAVVDCRAALEKCTLGWAQAQNNLGTALWRLGMCESGTARLQEAVTAYRAALEEYTRDRVPLGWAQTKNNLGNALTELGKRESGTARLRDAAAAYDAALEVFIAVGADHYVGVCRKNRNMVSELLAQSQEGIEGAVRLPNG
jgi:hypothetical protein